MYLYLKNNYVLFFGYLLCFFYFVNITIPHLVGGGGWVLIEQIAFGDRLVNEGVSLYSNGISDLYLPSSPYFPGVGYISAIFQYLGVTDLYILNIFMMITATAVGFSYFLLLKKLTKHLFPNISDVFILYALLFLFISYLSFYKYYIPLFKPDTILLVVATLIFFILEADKKIKLSGFIIVGSLLFVVTFFKQSFFLVFFLTYMLIFTNKTLLLKNKLWLMLIYSLVGVLALSIILNIDNLHDYTIRTTSHHPIFNISKIKSIFIEAYINNNIFIILMFIFILKNFNKCDLADEKTKYFIFGVVWLFFSLLSTIKLGGNRGNIEVGLVVFAPFAIQIMNVFSNVLKIKKALYIMVIIPLFSLLLWNYTNIIYKEFGVIKYHFNNYPNLVLYLENRFKTKSVFIQSNTYIISKMAGLKILTEVETINHFSMAESSNLDVLKNAITEKTYDVIYLNKIPSYKKVLDLKDLIDENYYIYQEYGMPSAFKNRLLLKRDD
jgi:hypothetical protein